eukprot:GHVL01006148.1.p1 GENE.GHVL01006148.1~~GHVL01006148.1.p1  ORF type:complete len:626 (+),score=161.17 GHVL01006148.1:47-1924(+)
MYFFIFFFIFNKILSFDGKISAFGDYNNDKYIDVFTVKFNQDENNSKITVWTWFSKYRNYWNWNNTDGKFYKNNELEIDGKIVNIIPIDYDMDGKLDIIIITKDILYNIIIYKQIDNDLIYNNILKPISNIQPIFIDINNDGFIDIIGQTPSDDRIIWLNNKGIFNHVLEFSQIMNISKIKIKKILNPHSSSIVDVDGDCISDLIIEVLDDDEGGEEGGGRMLEIWLAKQDHFQLLEMASPVKIPAGAGQLTWGDFNADGSMDFVFPKCTIVNGKCTGDNEIWMVPNIQIPVCSHSIFNPIPDPTQCRPFHKLCDMPDPNFHFPDLSLKSDISISSVLNKDINFIFSDDNPMTLRMADFDLDGFADLLAVTDDGKIRILNNVEHSDNILRRFEAGWEDDLFSNITANETVHVTAAPFDIEDDGVLDILASGSYVTANKTETVIETRIMTASSEFFFLRAVGLNGVCPESCPNAPRFPNPKPYGVNQIGSVFKLTVTDVNGVKSARVGTQLSQTAYAPLQLPFVYFGLGRTNNYLEEFYMGQSLKSSIWISIIPNTQVIAIPYPRDNPKKWTLELSVNPSSKFPFILLTTFAMLVIIGLIILVLDRKEKSEDSRQRESFRVHFIAT